MSQTHWSNKAKAHYFNDRACINYKEASNAAFGQKYPLQDLNSTACVPRLVWKQFFFASVSFFRLSIGSKRAYQCKQHERNPQDTDRVEMLQPWC